MVEKYGAPGPIRTGDPLLRSRVTTLIKTCRSERKAEHNQQVVTNPDQLLAPSLSPLSSRFVTICHNYYYVFMTAARLPWRTILHSMLSISCLQFYRFQQTGESASRSELTPNGLELAHKCTVAARQRIYFSQVARGKTSDLDKNSTEQASSGEQTGVPSRITISTFRFALFLPITGSRLATFSSG